MPVVPELQRKLSARDVPGTRDSLRRLRATGTPTIDLAETVVAEADELIRAGDLVQAERIIFHAVHDGVPIHEIFTCIRVLGEKK